MKKLTERAIINTLRISLSFILLWAFFDKFFGLGFSTSSGQSVLSGASPTEGFLMNGTKGFFAPIFQSLSGSSVVDCLFMSGLLLIGLSLLFGIGMRIACVSGILLMTLLYLSLFPPQNNPLLDEHVMYSLIFLLLLVHSEKNPFAFGRRWRSTFLVKNYPILI